ncbi:MAG: dihydrofolate reductase family protein, partial [Pyrinomonadaceae bacterium]
SLDNRLARTGGGMDWLLWSDEVTELMNDFWPRIDTILMGRKTYEVAMAGASPDDAGANPYGDMNTYIFSRTLTPGPLAGGAEIIGDDVGKFVGKLKQEDGKDICVMGGGDLARSMFEAGVIDEIGLNIHPILLGSVFRFFTICPIRSTLSCSNANR